METINGKGITVNVEFEDVFPEYCYVDNGKCHIYVEADNKLNFLMDRMRYENGLTPFYTSFNGCELDYDDWYEFRIIVDLDRGVADTVYCGVPIGKYTGEEYYIQIDDVMPQVIKELEKRGMTFEDLKNLN